MPRTVEHIDREEADLDQVTCSALGRGGLGDDCDNGERGIGPGLLVERASRCRGRIVGSEVVHPGAGHGAVPNGDRGFVVPEVFFAEVVSAVSKQSRNPALLLQCTAMLDQLPVERVEWSRLPKERCIELIRSRVGAYDAVYAAIALDRQVPLITSDARLARALGEPAWVVLLP